MITPAYNSEKYVGKAIESILNQTFTDFEFIILNDGSTDNTPKIVKEYLHAEDYDFYSRFCRYSEIHNIQEILYLYRIHGNNVSVKHASIQSRNSEKVRQDILNFLTHDHITQTEIRNILTKREKKYYLFNFIPLLKKKEHGNKIKIYLFNILPILKIKK